MNRNKWKELENISRNIRKDILMMHSRSNSSHVGSALSSVDILVALYFQVMKLNERKPNDKNRDRFILSKGHAASALYATLAKRGFFPRKVLEQYCLNGSKLPGHATKGCVPGIEASTGSLGHGLSMGIGMALAEKHDGGRYRVFVLLSDGECDEGEVWEAALFAGHHKLDNLVAIVDYNKFQAFGKTKDVLDLEPFSDKWKAFGWETKEIDGHSFKEIVSAAKNVPFRKGRPSLIIAHTIKGKGVSFMENALEWHYRTPSKEKLSAALKELGEKQ